MNQSKNYLLNQSIPTPLTRSSLSIPKINEAIEMEVLEKASLVNYFHEITLLPRDLILILFNYLTCILTTLPFSFDVFFEAIFLRWAAWYLDINQQDVPLRQFLHLIQIHFCNEKNEIELQPELTTFYFEEELCFAEILNSPLENSKTYSSWLVTHDMKTGNLHLHAGNLPENANDILYSSNKMLDLFVYALQNPNLVQIALEKETHALLNQQLLLLDAARNQILQLQKHLRKKKFNEFWSDDNVERFRKTKHLMCMIGNCDKYFHSLHQTMSCNLQGTNLATQFADALWEDNERSDSNE